MKNILIVAKKDGKEILDTAREVMSYLETRGLKTSCDVATARDMDIPGIDPGRAKCDLLLVLGGDGTLLWAESKISGRKIPILGVNFGTMGFLTEISPDNWKEAIDRVLEGRYTIEKRSKIDVSINGKNVGKALNEVVVKTRGPHSRYTGSCFHNNHNITVQARFKTHCRARQIADNDKARRKTERGCSN
jgi:NAD+ kinase